MPDAYTTDTRAGPVMYCLRLGFELFRAYVRVCMLERVYMYIVCRGTC